MPGSGEKREMNLCVGSGNFTITFLLGIDNFVCIYEQNNTSPDHLCCYLQSINDLESGEDTRASNNEEPVVSGMSIVKFGRTFNYYSSIFCLGRSLSTPSAHRFTNPEAQYESAIISSSIVPKTADQTLLS